MGRGFDRWLIGKSMAEEREAQKRRFAMQAQAMQRSLESKSGMSAEAQARRLEDEKRRNWEHALLADVSRGRAVPREEMESDWGRRLRTQAGLDLLGEAIIRGRMDLMDDLCSVFDAHGRRGAGLSSLMLCARQGSVEMLRRLVGLGLEIDFSDEQGRSALFHAAEAGNAAGVAALLERGAKVLPDRLGKTAASAAAEAGCVKSLSAMARAGVDVLARDPNGFTPFVSACLRGHCRAAQWLVEMGADPFDLGPADQEVLSMVSALGRGGDAGRREVEGWLSALAEGREIGQSSAGEADDGRGSKRL